MAASKTDHKRGGAIKVSKSHHPDICMELVSLGYGTMTECINASYACINCNDINEVRDELTKNENVVSNETNRNEDSPSPPLYRNRAYHYHLFPDIPPPADPYPDIIIREWIYSEDEATPAPTSPNTAEITHHNERKGSESIIKKSNTDSASTVMPISLEIPPFVKLMNSLSMEGWEDDEMKDSGEDDDTDCVQLYEVIRDITNMNNHSDVAKNVLLLTHHLVTNSNTILKCLEQRVFRDDHDSDTRVSTTSTGSGHSASPSITTTSTHHSIPSFTSFSTVSETALTDSRSRSNETVQSNAPILSSFLVQSKVIEFIRFWMMEYWKEDWQSNAKLRARCKLFISRYKENDKLNLNSKEFAKAEIMIKLLEDIMNSPKHGQLSKASEFFGDKVDFTTPLILSNLPTLHAQAYNKSTSNGNSKRLRRTTSRDILDVDSKAIADALTLILFNIFSDIKARECLDQNWKKEDKYILAPNIAHYIDTFNAITAWIQTTILFARSVKHRCQTIKQWLKIQEHFHKLSNFMGVSVVGCALKSCAIYKLKDAWHFVEKKHSKLLKKHAAIEMIMAKRGNWSKLRELQRNTDTSIIPFFPMFATDMIAMNEFHKKRVKNGTINFETLCKMNDAINEHLGHQKRPYNHIKSDATRQRWINKQLNVAAEYTEQQLFDICQSVVMKDQNELGNKSKMQK